MRDRLDNGLIVLAALSIAVSVASVFAAYWWIFELFTHFGVQLVVVQFGLCTLLMLRSHYRWMGAVLLAAALGGYPLRHYLVPGITSVAARTAGDETGRFIVMSVNLFGDNADLDALIASIERDAPDMVVMQEYRPFAMTKLGELYDEYPYRVEVPRTDYWGMAIYSRIRFDESKIFALGPASSIDATLTIDGRKVRVIGVHLSTPLSRRRAAERTAQLSQLATLVRSGELPTIVVGDLNLTPYSPHFARFLETSGLRDPLAGRGPRMTWPSYFPLLGIPIDHCLISSDWRIIGYGRQPNFGSDHFPIVVNLVYADHR